MTFYFLLIRQICNQPLPIFKGFHTPTDVVVLWQQIVISEPKKIGYMKCEILWWKLKNMTQLETTWHNLTQMTQICDCYIYHLNTLDYCILKKMKKWTIYILSICYNSFGYAYTFINIKRILNILINVVYRNCIACSWDVWRHYTLHRENIKAFIQTL